MVTRMRLVLSLGVGLAVVALVVVAGLAQSQDGRADSNGTDTSSAARGRGPSPNPKVRRPPFPNGRLPEEILANLSYGIKQMRLDEAPGREALGGSLVAGRILDVTSDIMADYYVVELVAAGGGPLADVAIGKDGFVLSVWNYQPGAPRRLAPDLDDVKSKLTRRFGSAEAKYYHTTTNIEIAGGSVYVPLIAADTPRGRVFVNSNLDLYVEETFKPFTRPDANKEEFQEFREANGVEQFRITRKGMGKLRRLGKL
jgi:hypothetical protein